MDFHAKFFFFFYTSIKVTKLNNFSRFVFFQSTYVYIRVCLCCVCIRMGGHNKTRQQHAAPPSNPKVPHMNESGWSEQVGGLDREPIVKRRLGRGDTKRKPVINGTTAAPLFSQMKIRDVGTRATGTIKEQNEKNISFCHGWHFV